MPPALQLLQRIFVALLVGLLIGLERERADLGKTRKAFAGARTFSLIGLLGAGLAALVPALGPALLITGFLAVAAIATVSYLRASAAGDFGATTEIAALGTFALGVLAGVGELLPAVAIGVAMTVLLAAKPFLAGLSRALTQQEIAAALQLAVISAVVLPILPNEGFGPWRVLNPFRIWLVVVLVSGVSFGGFVAVRIWGARLGLLLAAVVGALASSTAVTVAMAARARQSPAHAPQAAAGVALATAVMCVRVAALVGVTGPRVLPYVAPSLVAIGVSAALMALLLARAHRDGPEPGSAQGVTNPFSLTSALIFGAIFALVLVAVRAARELFGSTGLFVAAGLSGIANVDAIALALARDAAGAGGVRDAAAGIALAAVTSTLTKLGICLGAGRGSFRRATTAALIVVGAVGLVAAALAYARAATD
jgi:uncharacterized membrane protein (DUF4010 family)